MKTLIASIMLILPLAAMSPKPDKTFLLPEIAGTLRLGLGTADNSFWLADAKVKESADGRKTTYTITGKQMGKATATVEFAKLKDTQGYTVKIEAQGLTDGTSLYWAYGAALGQEAAPSDGQNNLIPDHCADNVFSVEGEAFTVYYGTSRKLKIVSVISPYGSDIALSDANVQASPADMFRSGKKTKAQALCAKCPIRNGEPLYFVVYKQNPKADYNRFMLPKLHTDGTYIIHEDTNWMESTPN